MATPKKAGGATRKSAPRSAAQIHSGRITDKQVKEAMSDAEDLEITDVSEWKSSNDRGARKLKLPSGFVCLARNPGMMWFIEQGLLPNSLMELVTDALDAGKEGKANAKATAAEVKKLVSSGELGTMLEFANVVVVHSVVKPRINATPAPDIHNGVVTVTSEDKKDSSLLYADEVDLDDKMFIFNWVVGGSHDLDKFHEG